MNRSSRIDSLINSFGINSDCIYARYIDIIDSIIGWNRIDEKLKLFRESSLHFLKQA
jgi:hypothetical protein